MKNDELEMQKSMITGLDMLVIESTLNTVSYMNPVNANEFYSDPTVPPQCGSCGEIQVVLFFAGFT